MISKKELAIRICELEDLYEGVLLRLDDIEKKLKKSTRKSKKDETQE